MQWGCSWSVPSEQGEQAVESVCEAVPQLFAKVFEIYSLSSGKETPPALTLFTQN